MEKTDEGVLFPEVEIDGIVVKPWSFGMLFELAESLDRVIKRLEDHPKLLEEVTDLGTTISYITIARLFALANDEVMSIICKTINKSEEEVIKFPMDTGIRIAMQIFQQNSSSIKNVWTSQRNLPKRKKP